MLKMRVISVLGYSLSHIYNVKILLYHNWFYVKWLIGVKAGLPQEALLCAKA